MSTFRIATIPGDGIGKEVVPEGIRVLEAVGKKFDISFEWDSVDWSCEYYTKHGRMMPEDGLDQIRNHDAIFLGAVGFPGVPDHVSLWGLLIPIRRQFHQYINLRPVRLMPGVPSPLANREPGDIDFGEYSSIGGRIYEGTEQEFAVQETGLALRLRAGEIPAREAPDLCHQIERHHDHHCPFGTNGSRPWQSSSMRSASTSTI